MPYIKQETRRVIASGLYALIGELNNLPKDEVEGAVNYAFSCILLAAVIPGKPHYADFEKAIGLLECCKLELYRRMVAPYEDQKALENGDVYK